MISIYLFYSYQDYLKAIIRESKVRGFQSALAKAAGCQTSYFSLVLNNEKQLKPDHAMGICTYLNFNSWQTEYMLKLVLYARAETADLQMFLRNDLDRIRDKHGPYGLNLKRVKTSKPNNNTISRIIV